MKAPALAAEFDDPEQFLRAVHSLRARGFTLEAYTPYPLRGLDEALAAPPSRLPYLIFAVAMAAAGLAYFFQWLLDDALYPLNVGARPPHFPVSFVPITFEMGVLFGGFTAFAGTLALGKLLRLWHPIFELEGFETASKDGLWLAIERLDSAQLHALAQELQQSGARRIRPEEALA
jgi:hypothetical protein